MGKQTRNLFPDDPGPIGSMTNDLFGHSNNSASTPNSTSKPNGASSYNHASTINIALGGNVHELSDRQINKLIHLKFNNDPIQLIRQLSLDLTAKESELIMLRKEKFIREQELLRLCNEYGNLSKMEIDRKLNDLEVDHSIDRVLADLIGTALNDDLAPKGQTGIANEMADGASCQSNGQSSVMTRSSTRANSITTRKSRSSSWLPQWFNNESAEQLNPHQAHHRQGHDFHSPGPFTHVTINESPLSSSNSHKSNDAHTLESAKNTDDHSITNNNDHKSNNKLSFLPGLGRLKSPTLSIGGGGGGGNMTKSPLTTRVPVELDSINFHDYDPNEIDDHDNNDNEYSNKHQAMLNLDTDKYGFFNDLDNLVFKKHSENVESSSTSSLNAKSDKAHKSGYEKVQSDQQLMIAPAPLITPGNSEMPLTTHSVSSSKALAPPEAAILTSRPASTNSGNTALSKHTTSASASGTSASAIVNDVDAIGTTSINSSTPTIDKLKILGQLHDAKNSEIERSWDVFVRDILNDFHKYNNHRNLHSAEYNHNKSRNARSSQTKSRSSSGGAVEADYSMVSGLINEEIFGIRGLNLMRIRKTSGSGISLSGASSISNDIVDHDDVTATDSNKIDYSTDMKKSSTDLRKTIDDRYHQHSQQPYYHYGKLQHMINQSGIPPKYRKYLWMELSGATNLRVAGEYPRLVDVGLSHNDSDDFIGNNVITTNIHQINLDLHRTMPLNVYFNDLINSQPGPNFYKLQRILYAFVVYRPEIGYCQGMNKIVGNLLLGLGGNNVYGNAGNEENVFWTFVGFIEEILPQYQVQAGESIGGSYHHDEMNKGNGKLLNYFDKRSLPYIRIDQNIMIEVMFPRVMPRLYDHLVNRCLVQIEFITLNWWLSIFTESFLSLEIWFKLFDSLLVSEVIETKLISLTLAIFKIFESLLMSIDNGDEVYSMMKSLDSSVTATKVNLKFSEIVKISNSMDRKFSINELYAQRRMHQER